MNVSSVSPFWFHFASTLSLSSCGKSQMQTFKRRRKVLCWLSPHLLICDTDLSLYGLSLFISITFSLPIKQKSCWWHPFPYTLISLFLSSTPPSFLLPRLSLPFFFLFKVWSSLCSLPLWNSTQTLQKYYKKMRWEFYFIFKELFKSSTYLSHISKILCYELS